MKPNVEWSSQRRNTSRAKFRISFLLFVAIALHLAVFAGCGAGTASGPFNPGAQFDSLWEAFDQNYSYFVYKNIDWNAAKSTFRPMAVATTDEASLVSVLKQMLGQLHDQHVNFTDPSRNEVPTFTPAFFINWDQTVWQKYMIAGNFVQVQPALVTANISGVPYIAITVWNPSLVDIAHLDAVIDANQLSSALIIDVRMNPGGDDSIAYQFADRFTAQTRTTEFIQLRDGPSHSDFTPIQSRTVTPRGSFQFTKPVYLLIGRYCTSSTENFIAAMRELPNVTVIGDTSGGASGNPMSFTLGGGWSYTVSHWLDYTAEMQMIEDQGISPAINVAVTTADFQQGKDPVIDFAVTKAATRTGSLATDFALRIPARVARVF